MEQRREEWDHKSFKLKRGDRAYWIVNEWGEIATIEIIGKCGDDKLGHGYTARLLTTITGINFKRIHTCNGFMTPDKAVAIAEGKRLAKKCIAASRGTIQTQRRQIQFFQGYIKKLDSGRVK